MTEELKLILEHLDKLGDKAYVFALWYLVASLVQPLLTFTGVMVFIAVIYRLLRTVIQLEQDDRKS